MDGLQVRDLTVRYGGVTALDRVKLDASRGTITGLVGPNGSGKSSFINAVSGVPDLRYEGSVELAGTDLREVPGYRRAQLGLARIFQGIRLFDTLTVEENIVMGAHSLNGHGFVQSVLRTGKSRSDQQRQRERAHEVMSIFGSRLLPYKDEQVLRLSYANRRRAELARALMSHPTMLLLDEPAAGMNPHETEELVEQLASLAEEMDISMLLVEHKMSVIDDLCSDVYVLDSGKVIAHGTPAEIQEDPAVIEAFLG